MQQIIDAVHGVFVEAKDGVIPSLELKLFLEKILDRLSAEHRTSNLDKKVVVLPVKITFDRSKAPTGNSGMRSEVVRLEILVEGRWQSVEVSRKHCQLPWGLEIQEVVNNAPVNADIGLVRIEGARKGTNLEVNSLVITKRK